jgi:Fur family ferric uptake transcriptional regulator
MEAISILRENKIRITPNRIEILTILEHSEKALAEKEIQEHISGKCDRATIYRTLSKLTASGIIHPITTELGIKKYVFKKEKTEHLHFKCTECGDTICLTKTKMNNFKLPEGFVKRSSNYLVIGTCKKCNQK